MEHGCQRERWFSGGGGNSHQCHVMPSVPNHKDQRMSVGFRILDLLVDLDESRFRGILGSSWIAVNRSVEKMWTWRECAEEIRLCRCWRDRLGRKEFCLLVNLCKLAET